MTALPAAAAGSTGSDRLTRIRFTNPNFEHLAEHIRASAARGLPMVPREAYGRARGAVICGSGPSLTTPATLARIRGYQRRGWHVIACKEAIRLLLDRGVRVDFSVSMDPGAEQWRKTARDAAIVYCVASSCHAALFDWLLDEELTVWVFHSACGCPGEAALYASLFPCADVMQGGYTVLNRALALAVYMGFPRRVLAGADFGWRPGAAGYYAAGAREAAGNLGADLTDQGLVDGREWLTRPDLLASAIAVARLKRRGAVDAILGDSLAGALARRDEAFLKRVLPEG